MVPRIRCSCTILLWSGPRRGDSLVHLAPNRVHLRPYVPRVTGPLLSPLPKTWWVVQNSCNLVLRDALNPLSRPPNPTPPNLARIGPSCRQPLFLCTNLRNLPTWVDPPPTELSNVLNLLPIEERCLRKLLNASSPPLARQPMVLVNRPKPLASVPPSYVFVPCRPQQVTNRLVRSGARGPESLLPILVT